MKHVHFIVLSTLFLVCGSVAGATQRQPGPDVEIFNVTSNLFDLSRGGSIKMTVAHLGKRKVAPSIVVLYILNERDEVIRSKKVEIGPGRPASLKLRRSHHQGRKKAPVRAVYHQPLDSKLELGMTVEVSTQNSPFSPINSLELATCPPKVPPGGGERIDYVPDCGCGVGRPTDFVVPTRPRP